MRQTEPGTDECKGGNPYGMVGVSIVLVVSVNFCCCCCCYCCYYWCLRCMLLLLLLHLSVYSLHVGVAGILGVSVHHHDGNINMPSYIDARGSMPACIQPNFVCTVDDRRDVVTYDRRRKRSLYSATQLGHLEPLMKRLMVFLQRGHRSMLMTIMTCVRHV